MPHGRVVITVPASSEAVFRVLHDYDRRLEWDTLLQEARLCDGWTTAQLHATSICRGRWFLGGIALETQYITFKRGEVAAVKMTNRPAFFDTFAATIRHRDLPGNGSSVEYIYQFTARPRWLRSLLHPIMNLAFAGETRKRLRSLRRYCGGEKVAGGAIEARLVDESPGRAAGDPGGGQVAVRAAVEADSAEAAGVEGAAIGGDLAVVKGVSVVGPQCVEIQRKATH